MIEITKDFRKYAPAIWRREHNAPSFFQQSVNTWRDTFESFLEFADEKCAEIYGIFTGKELMCCIYFEKPAADTLTVHLSVSGDFDRELVLREIRELRDIQFSKGIKQVNAWVLERNRGLRAIVREIGFAPTELSMLHGSSHGRSLRWRLHRMVRI